jgi:hypothetical protein
LSAERTGGRAIFFGWTVRVRGLNELNSVRGKEWSPNLRDAIQKKGPKRRGGKRYGRPSSLLSLDSSFEGDDSLSLPPRPVQGTNQKARTNSSSICITKHTEQKELVNR